MNKLQLSPLIAAMSLTYAMYANAQTDAQTADQAADDQSRSASPSLTPGAVNPMPATHPAEGTAADRTPPGQTPVRGTAAAQAPEQATSQGSEEQNENQQNAQDQQRSSASGPMTPGTVNPIPATRRAEGTAADSSPPGETPVRGAAASQAPAQPTGQGQASEDQREDRSQGSASSSTPSSANAMPATRTTEGTAADNTPPGQTPARGAADSSATDQATSRIAMAEGASEGPRRGSTVIGSVVKDSQGQRAGTVQDIIMDPQSGRVTHAVVAQGSPSDSLVLIPWRSVESMQRSGAMVVDRDRLASAPKFDSSAWPDLSRSGWSQQADRYWDAEMSGSADTTQRESGTRSR